MIANPNPYLRLSRARRVYVCDECGATISRRAAYFRDEPHPKAHQHRGAKVRYLCTKCVTGLSQSEFIAASAPETPQLSLPFSVAIANLPGLLFQAAVVKLREHTADGAFVEAVTLPWFEILSQIEKDPRFLYQVPWRRLEELIAGAYEEEGWDEVTITPRSGDLGRDIIAVKRGVCAIRIIDQVKAYSPGRRVSANDVRALLGVLSSDPNVSKGFVTTTAEFAPGISEDPSIKPFIPYRLELKDGCKLRKWLMELKSRRGY